MFTTFYLTVLSLTELVCFIFIAAPISSLNPCAFPEELKSKQTTIKLIEAARYQLRCCCPWQQNPPLTLQDPYSVLPVKIQFYEQQPLTRLLTLFLNGSDWNTHSPDYHAGEGPLLWVGHEHDRLAAPSVSFHHEKMYFNVFIFNCDIKSFLVC